MIQGLERVLLAALIASSVAGAQTERPDLLTFARGALFIEQTGLASGSSGTAIQVIDGDPKLHGLTIDRKGPVEIVYRLPAKTTFDRFAIPGIVERPGNVTFVKTVTIWGSTEGPRSGFRKLVAFDLKPPVRDQPPVEAVPEIEAAVEWIKVRFEGGILIEEAHRGKTAIQFSELIGNGTQEAQTLSNAFDGAWELRLIERTDLRGKPLRLKQEGTRIVGCYGDYRIQGTVNGKIARATGNSVQNDRPVAMIMVADDDGGVLRAAVSENKGRFGSRITVADPDPESAPCPEESKVCGASIYVNFDFDSATIRLDSKPVLADIHAQLVEEGASKVVVEGHTSTEGAADYNLRLSENRAQAVADDLVTRGLPKASISSVGKGETEPLVSPDRTETARSLNRRVVIRCE